MDVKLRVTQGKNVGQEVPIPGKKFLIGRAEDCHLRAGSDLISRHHCIIIIEDGYLAVRDFGSKNGTSVNGERVVGECELKHGDELRLGPLEFVLQVTQGSLSGKKKPPVHDAKEAAAHTAASGAEEEPDVARWLSEPAQVVVDPSTQDTQMLRTSDTDEIDVGSTREFGLEPIPVAGPAAAQPAVVAAPAKPVAVAVKAAPPAVAAKPAPAAPAAKSAPAAPAGKPAPVAPAGKPAPVAATPAPAKAVVAEPAQPVPRPSAPLPAFVADPAPESQAPAAAEAVPPPAAEKRGFFGGGGKKFGKLPQLPQQGTKDSRSAASDMLDKMRKRR